jgi:hypothetical protein
MSGMGRASSRLRASNQSPFCLHAAGGTLGRAAAAACDVSVSELTLYVCAVELLPACHVDAFDNQPQW